MEVYEILNILGDLDQFGVGQTPLQRRLELIREIQRVIPSAHVGGSIGFFLQGIDFGRDFINSDIDFSLTEPTADFFPLKKENLTNGNKFYQKETTRSSTDIDETDYFTDVTDSENPCEIKVEFKYDKTQTYSVIEFEGHKYQVTDKEILLGWKSLFASRGSKKHMDDLDLIGHIYPDKSQAYHLKRSYKTWHELKSDLSKI